MLAYRERHEGHGEALGGRLITDFPLQISSGSINHLATT